MNAVKINRLSDAVRAEVFSPKWLFSRALLLILFYAVCHAAGLREHVSFLSGTPGSTDTSLNVSAILGVACMVAYFGVVLVVPIFMIAAFLLKGQEWFLCGRLKSEEGSHYKMNKD